MRSSVRSTGTSWPRTGRPRSEEHTSELQSRSDLVCRLLLEKKKKEDNSGVKNSCGHPTSDLYRSPLVFSQMTASARATMLGVRFTVVSRQLRRPRSPSSDGN